MFLICIILKTGLFEVCMRSIYVTKTRPHLLEILAYVLLKKKSLRGKRTFKKHNSSLRR